jgi:hypothetical protein
MNRELPKELKDEIEADPYYFIYQGGSDGTYGNAIYWDDYGNFEPEISKYAAKILEEKGLTW